MKVAAENVLPASRGLLVGLTIRDGPIRVRFALLEIPWELIPWNEVRSEHDRWAAKKWEVDEDDEALF